jgi:hypothetical protein
MSFWPSPEGGYKIWTIPYREISQCQNHSPLLRATDSCFLLQSPKLSNGNWPPLDTSQETRISLPLLFVKNNTGWIFELADRSINLTPKSSYLLWWPLPKMLNPTSSPQYEANILLQSPKLSNGNWPPLDTSQETRISLPLCQNHSPLLRATDSCSSVLHDHNSLSVFFTNSNGSNMKRISSSNPPNCPMVIGHR